VKSEVDTRRVIVLNFAATRLARLPRAGMVAVGLVLIVAIAFLDHVTGPRIVLNVFYLLPVMLVAWATASTGCGLIVAVATFLVGPIEAALTGFRYDSLPVAIWNGAVRLAVFCIVLLLMARVRTLMSRLEEQALADELTGLANLRALRETVAREIERSRRFNHPMTLAYLDVDDFKAVNDRVGHDAGDRVLISLASVARATTRSIDTVVRVGGDEFVILMPETGAETALPVADRLREAFSRAVKVEGVPVTCSIGLASFERPPASVDEMLIAADELMYEAKAGGGDAVRQMDVDCRAAASQSGRVIAFAAGRRT
jgi:diguanylate cyclase (GGDEF)-like protein